MNLNQLPFIMLRCLILTIIIECIGAVFIFRLRDKKDIMNVLLVNVVTNPIVVSLPILIWVKYGYEFRMIALFVLELLTVLVEGFIYCKVLKKKIINPFLISLILNGLSYFIGEIINRI